MPVFLSVTCDSMCSVADRLAGECDLIPETYRPELELVLRQVQLAQKRLDALLFQMVRDQHRKEKEDIDAA